MSSGFDSARRATTAAVEEACISASYDDRSPYLQHAVNNNNTEEVAVYLGFILRLTEAGRGTRSRPITETRRDKGFVAARACVPMRSSRLDGRRAAELPSAEAFDDLCDGWSAKIPGEAITVMRQRRGIGAFLAVVGAFAWSIGFAVWAYVGAAGTECIISTTGAERCRSTPLVHGFGRELVLVLTPAIVCLVVWGLLRRYCTRGQRVALAAAAVLAGLFAVFCYLAGLSIGPLLLPTAGLLLLSVAATQPPAAASP